MGMSLLSLSIITSCAVKEELQQNSFEEGYLLPPVISIDLEQPETKTVYDFVGGRLRTHWAEGDVVFASPASYSAKGSKYTFTSGAGSQGTFVAERQITAYASQHVFYYPGDQIHNDAGFNNFSYEGQVQKKSDPMAHMARYHSMRQYVEVTKAYDDYDVSKVSFAGCDQSGCMVFDLSGVSFKNPKEIRLQVVKDGIPMSGVLYSSNRMSSYFQDLSTGDAVYNPSSVNQLSLRLEGYGSESSLVAYMMLPNHDMNLTAGCSLRVSVIGDSSYYADTPITKSTAIKGGYCSFLTVDGGWKKLEGDYTEYSWDGDVVTLQKGTPGLDIVIMGDGFIKADFDNGRYDQVMRFVYQNLFTIEPYKTLKNDFNVYYVKAVSPQRLEASVTGANGAVNSGNVSKFSVSFTANSTHISGDDDLARTYARKAFATNADKRIQDATIIVVANQEAHAGTCSNSWSNSNQNDYGNASAVAYVALGLNTEQGIELIHHEALGHGFGKLADEYYYNGSFSFSTGYWNDIKTYHQMGLYRNVDKFVTSRFNELLPKLATSITQVSDVLWYDMIGTSNAYETVEGLGFYEGGYTYPVGFCRPTEDGSMSIMNEDTGIFNAISRRQILYRYLRLKGDVNDNVFGTQSELSRFLQWDAQNFLPYYQGTTSPATKSASRLFSPSAPPEEHAGEWVNGEFHETR